MRSIILFVLLLVALGVAYVFVPTERMQMKAKDTIQQVQALEQTLDFDDVVDEFGSLFEKHKERLTGATEQEDADDEGVYTACTQEAKRCSDGSFVGRTGPDCAFAPCPGSFISCPRDTMACPGGGFVVRIAPDCSFAPCPGEEESAEVQDAEGGSAVLVR